MTTDLIFITNSLFEIVTYDSEADNWSFVFENNIYASSSGFWRILKYNKIILVSLDHGHQFGHPEPLDLISEINELLKGKSLVKIEVNKETADLKLIVSEEIKIEIFIASSGYETYEFSIENNRYIGVGSGDLAIIQSTINPQVYTTRKI